ncbi:MAG TPA: hypothetical protein DC058_03905 [Planctomycetaceae bacterium]|jgi:hypothetical protein|nr:hypothetical protein [Planctomycetaceae bacterium]HBC60348.1 hypothetical protein [Planctomycetaceae bacterium]
MRVVRLSFLSGVLVGAVLCLCSGCSDAPKVGEVTGVVTLSGQPIPFAFVVFQPTDPPGTYGSAYSDASGRYELKFTEGVNGALVGRHEVLVRTATVDELQLEDKSTGLMVTPPLPKGYRERQELVFNREVKLGLNEINLELSEGRSRE